MGRIMEWMTSIDIKGLQALADEVHDCKCVFRPKGTADSADSYRPRSAASRMTGWVPYWLSKMGGGQMPRSRIVMRRVREILHLRWEVGLSIRQIVRSSRLSHQTVLTYVRQAQGLRVAVVVASEL